MAVTMNKGHVIAIALIGSLMCNVFLAGWLIGFHWQKLPPPSQANNEDRISSDLFDALRTIPDMNERVRPIFHRHGSEIRPKVHTMRAARQQVKRLLLAKNFDSVAMQQALSQVANAEFALRTGTHQIFLEVLSTLTPEERHLLANSSPHHDRSERGHPPPPLDGMRRRWQPLPAFDRDHDGNVTWEEFSADSPPLRQHRLKLRFNFLDQNQDGLLDAQEMAMALDAEEPPPPPMMMDGERDMDGRF